MLLPQTRSRSSLKRRAQTVLELIVSCLVLGLLLIILATAMAKSEYVWRRLNGSADSSVRLKRAIQKLRRDLAQTEVNQLAIGASPATVGGFPDGSALWCLSCEAGDQPVLKGDSHPFWCKTILYYVSIPIHHDQLVGQVCAGGLGPEGVDDRCPHKCLIRKEIDLAPATTTSPQANEEVLPPLASLRPYMTRPQTLGAQEMKLEPGVKSVSVLAYPILSFKATQSNQQVNLDIRAVSILAARRKVRLGIDSLWDSPLTFQQTTRVMPVIGY